MTMSDLTQRARDVAGRLHKRPNTELAAMRQREKAAAIISELVERIEGLEGTVEGLYYEIQYPRD